MFRLISFLLFAAFALILGQQTLQISGMARVYPSVLVAIVVAGAVLMVIKEFVARKEVAVPHGDVAKLVTATEGERLRLLGFIALWGAYPWLLKEIGFIIATILAISVSFWLLKQKRLPVGVAGAALFAVSFAVLFSTVFYIPVPAGAIDDWLTRVLFLLRK